MRTPLAWKNLTHEIRRLLLAVGGVGFAVLLVFMQLGFRGALLEGTVQLPMAFNADLVLVSKTKVLIQIPEKFARQVLYQTRNVSEVDSAWPVYIDMSRSSWYLPGQTTRSLPIRTVAFNPRDPVLTLEDVRRHADELMMPDTIMFDRKSKVDYGKPNIGDVAYLNDNRLRVVGTFALGTDFATDATCIVSDRNYAQMFFPKGAADFGLSQVDIGLIKLKPGADVQTVKRELQSLLPEYIVVRTKAEYIAAEQGYWDNSTPVGYVFGFGVILGFVVGVIICYQVLYADVTDHMSEYATLKAMGYRARYFMGLVMQESLFISLLGFVPAMVAAELLYLGLEAMTGLPLNLTLHRAGGVLVLAVAMCVISGLLALRKLTAADPAELFR
jgi:putative ABC transport system permease protein